MKPTSARLSLTLSIRRLALRVHRVWVIAILWLHENRSEDEDEFGKDDPAAMERVISANRRKLDRINRELRVIRKRL